MVSDEVSWDVRQVRNVGRHPGECFTHGCVALLGLHGTPRGRAVGDEGGGPDHLPDMADKSLDTPGQPAVVVVPLSQRQTAAPTPTPLPPQPQPEVPAPLGCRHDVLLEMSQDMPWFPRVTEDELPIYCFACNRGGHIRARSSPQQGVPHTLRGVCPRARGRGGPAASGKGQG